MDNNIRITKSMTTTQELEMFPGQTQWIRKHRTEKSHTQGYKTTVHIWSLFWTYGFSNGKWKNQYCEPNFGTF